jgi:signal transduction histidine kinase
MPTFTRFRIQSIRIKLFFGFAILVFLSTLTQLIGFNLISSYIATQVNNSQNEKANEATQKIESFFTNIDTNNTGLANVYLENNKSNDKINTVTLYTIKNNDYIRKISFLSSSGKELYKFDKSGKVPENNLSFEITTKQFQLAILGKPAISKVYYLSNDTGPYVDFFAPINRKSASEAAVIKTQVSLAKLWNVISQTKIGKHGFAYIVDDEGRLIAHPDEKYLMTRPTLNSRPFIASNVTSDGYKYKNENNTDVIANAAKVARINWLTVFEQPTNEAFAFPNFLRRMFYITDIGYFIIMLVISIVVSNNLTQHIKQLKTAALSLEEGHLDTRSKIKSGDEIEELGNAFNTMADKLEDSFKSIEERDNELRTATKDLQSANNRLQQLDHLKDEFVSLASHELRTPMTAIKSYLWMFLQYNATTLDPKERQYIERAYEATDRLIVLVNDMLNVSRIESGRMNILFMPVDLPKLAREVTEELSPTALKQNIFFKIDAPENLPAVTGDQNKIREVITNLVGNSLKFSLQGGTITIRMHQDKDMIVTQVIDTGKGIKKEDLVKLFQKFGIVGNNYLQKTNSQGTGLGLYISKSIVELHGGTIWVNSEGEDKGATFAFTLKIDQGTKQTETHAQGYVAATQQVAPTS